MPYHGIIFFWGGGGGGRGLFYVLLSEDISKIISFNLF